jgi:formate hydrogenlyase subunit 6/NADH:ubiquinone oxidoreductase subunit I
MMRDTTRVSIAQELCTRYLHKASTCQCCSEGCPTGAITLTRNHPIYDAALCLKCGACASICPMGAIEVLMPSDTQLEKEIIARSVLNEKITFTCKESEKKREGVISLKCLARLEPSLLLLALAKGAAEVKLISGECQKCALNHTLSSIHKTIEMTQKYADLCSVHTSIALECVPTMSDNNLTCKDHSRRTFFLKLFRQKRVESSVITTKITHENTKMPIPKKHQRFLQSLRLLIGKTLLIRSTDALFLSPTIDMTQCIGCTICANICPTEALETDVHEEKLRITCKRSRCVACHLCVDVCFKKAITLEAYSDLDAMLSTQQILLYERQKNEDAFPRVAEKMSTLLGAKIYNT